MKFKKQLELEYQEHYFRESLTTVRTGLLLAFVLYNLFAILDIWMLPITKGTVWIIRFGIVDPFLIGAYILSYFAFFKKVMQVVLSIIALVMGYGIIVMIAFSLETELGFRLYYAGLILVIMWAYALIRLHFIYAVVSCLLLIAGYEITAIFIQKMLMYEFTSSSFMVFINNSFFFISANIIGMLAAYTINSLLRSDFLQRKQLVDAARETGMKEMAIGVVHNIGNVLNSVIISSEEILRQLENSNVKKILKANKLLQDNMDHVQDFLTRDPRGQLLPEYYLKVGDEVEKEMELFKSEAMLLKEKIELIKSIVDTQKIYTLAPVRQFYEPINLINTVEDVLKIESINLSKNDIQIKRKYHHDDNLEINADKHKVLNILLNLIKNAIDALSANDPANREIIISIDSGGTNTCHINIADNGEGIVQENLQRIFQFGFTTKENGHGFGLHTCANFMSEMEGRIEAKSDGTGTGATFCLCFPEKL